VLLLAAALALQAADRPVADHEAVVISYRNNHQEQDLTRTLVRSGRWLRQGTASGATHSDFESGTSVTYARDEAGRYRYIAIGRTPTTDPDGRYRRERTGGRDRALGEECEIWRLVRVDSGAHGPEVLSCETHDGIELWTRTQGSDIRHIIIAETRTLSFRRRPVAPSEVLPPADLLRWDYWFNLPPLSGAPPPPRAPLEYELRLGPADDYAVERSRIMRRRGPWTYLERVRDHGIRSIAIDNRIVSLTYEAEADGRPIRLTLQRMPAMQLSNNDAVRYVRIAPPASEQVLGEPCFWSVPDWGRGVDTSGAHRFCLSADGLPLRISAHHHVLIANLTATALSRAPPPFAAMMPPREAFDWARWGIRPAD
jgi:hypothetical protein